MEHDELECWKKAFAELGEKWLNEVIPVAEMDERLTAALDRIKELEEQLSNS